MEGGYQIIPLSHINLGAAPHTIKGIYRFIGDNVADKAALLEGLRISGTDYNSVFTTFEKDPETGAYHGSFIVDKEMFTLIVRNTDIVNVTHINIKTIQTDASDANAMINEIVNGTTPAGDASKFGGHPSSDYAFSDDVSVSKAELQALGWCVPSEMPIKNSFANGVLTQRVGRIEASTLSWIRNDNVYRAIVSNRAEGTNGAFLDGYTYFQNKGFLVENGMISDSGSSTYSMCIFVGDSRFSNVYDFKNSLHGKYLYYVLGTPITHNINNLPSQKSMISDAWDDDPSNKVYYVGDLRIDGNRLYECYVQTDKTSGRPSVDTAHWRKTSVAEKLTSTTVARITKENGVYAFTSGKFVNMVVDNRARTFRAGDVIATGLPIPLDTIIVVLTNNIALELRDNGSLYAADNASGTWCSGSITYFSI